MDGKRKRIGGRTVAKNEQLSVRKQLYYPSKRGAVSRDGAYCLVLENLQIVYTDGTGESSFKVALVRGSGGVEADKIVVLSGGSAAIPGARFGDNIHNPMQRSGFWQFP